MDCDKRSTIKSQIEIAKALGDCEELLVQHKDMKNIILYYSLVLFLLLFTIAPSLVYPYDLIMTTTCSLLFE